MKCFFNKKKEMGGACGTHGSEWNTVFLCENMKEINHVEDLRVNGWIILKWFFNKKKEMGGAYGTHGSELNTVFDTKI